MAQLFFGLYPRVQKIISQEQISTQRALARNNPSLTANANQSVAQNLRLFGCAKPRVLFANVPRGRVFGHQRLVPELEASEAGVGLAKVLRPKLSLGVPGFSEHRFD